VSSADLQTALRRRAGPLLSLVFLVGPASDLAGLGASPARTGAIAAALLAFVALYLALLPPAGPLERRGRYALGGALALLAATAGLILALGAPRSLVLLFVYVVAASGLLLESRLAAAVTAVTAAGVAAGLAADGADGAAVSAYALTVLAIGALTAAFASADRTNRELRAAREELARLAVSEERLRIARDLHDLLGHALTVIALKSELAAKLLRRDPDRAEGELAEVQHVTRQALADVREALLGYRHVAFPDALRSARAALAAAGIDCRVESAAAELPPDVETVLAWAVREAATNVVRHSGAHACAISLTTEPDAVALEVEDDGVGAASSGGGAATTVASEGGGTGLAGLAERARRLQGTLEAGARPQGGFRLRLTLPLRAA
jgi:two-component system, NarL family, sensor histidine kinase DesK